MTMCSGAAAVHRFDADGKCTQCGVLARDEKPAVTQKQFDDYLARRQAVWCAAYGAAYVHFYCNPKFDEQLRKESATTLAQLAAASLRAPGEE